MTDSTAPASVHRLGHPVDLRRVTDGLVVADAVRDDLQQVTEEVQVDRWELRGRCSVAALDIGAALALGGDGHIAQIRVEDGPWSLTARADGPAQPAVDMDGSPEDVLTGTEIDNLHRAIERSSAADALRVVERLACWVQVVIRNDPEISGAHWIHRSAELSRLLASDRWHATATALATGSRVIVIGDAGSTSVVTGGLTLCGPAAADVAQPAHLFDDSAYRHLRRQDGRVGLPSPGVFVWTDGESADRGALQNLGPRFSGIARCLVWYWLAADAHIAGSGRVDVTFSGARTVSLTLAPVEVVNVQADLALYAWAATGNDPARAEAIQHAASLAVMYPSDLDTAAAPALRTARSLYELSRRAAIGEALTASRSAREATLNAARQAASTARETAGKTVERGLLQVAAATAVVLTNATNLLGRVPAFYLLLMVAGLTITSLFIAVFVELCSAERALASELSDLDQYRDVLASDDIAAVRRIQVVAAARKDLRRSGRTTVCVYLGTAIAILVIGGILILNHHHKAVPATPPSPTRTTPTSAPATR